MLFLKKLIGILGMNRGGADQTCNRGYMTNKISTLICGVEKILDMLNLKITNVEDKVHVGSKVALLLGSSTFLETSTKGSLE